MVNLESQSGLFAQLMLFNLSKSPEIMLPRLKILVERFCFFVLCGSVKVYGSIFLLEIL